MGWERWGLGFVSVSVNCCCFFLFVSSKEIERLFLAFFFVILIFASLYAAGARINPDLLLCVFLPALLFESSFAMDVHQIKVSYLDDDHSLATAKLNGCMSS